ncbi:hypothetical protein QFZ75_007355 [Streptomyces sp. V3I8]|nr:hypothetical protein [Streptomyces sp. V3I8]
MDLMDSTDNTDDASPPPYGGGGPARPAGVPV